MEPFAYHPLEAGQCPLELAENLGCAVGLAISISPVPLAGYPDPHLGGHNLLKAQEGEKADPPRPATHGISLDLEAHAGGPGIRPPHPVQNGDIHRWPSLEEPFGERPDSAFSFHELGVVENSGVLSGNPQADESQHHPDDTESMHTVPTHALHSFQATESR
jgi:hypothetical protein